MMGLSVQASQRIMPSGDVLVVGAQVVDSSRRPTAVAARYCDDLMIH